MNDFDFLFNGIIDTNVFDNYKVEGDDVIISIHPYTFKLKLVDVVKA